MVDIDAKLRIEISVKDYEQVVRNDKGRLIGTMSKVPGASSFVKGKVDETIEEEVKKQLAVSSFLVNQRYSWKTQGHV